MTSAGGDGALARSAAAGPRPHAGAREWSAVALLLFGGLIGFLGWLVGLALLWTSRVWTLRDKLIGTLVVPGGCAMAVIFLLTAAFPHASHCTGSPDGIPRCTPAPTQPAWAHALGITAVVLLVLLPIATAVYLVVRARRAVDG